MLLTDLWKCDPRGSWFPGFEGTDASRHATAVSSLREGRMWNGICRLLWIFAARCITVPSLEIGGHTYSGKTKIVTGSYRRPVAPQSR